MKPVLLEVNRSCGSAWIPVDGTSRAVVSGLRGESHIRLEFDGVLEPFILEDNGEYELPDGVSLLKAKAVILEEGITVNLDLV